MQKVDDVNEIDTIGLKSDEENDTEDFDFEPYEHKKTHSIVPILQMSLCAIILVALVIIKFTDNEKFNTIADWYKESASQEVELPKALKEKLPDHSESSDSSSSELESEISDVTAQRL